ncbi:MAG: hypothetical protein ACT4QE_22560, partial [Anaerolineales bacterium]
LLALGLGRVQLSAYEATPLTYLRGPAHTQTYQHIVQTFGLPEPVRAALQKQEQPDRYDYYWNHDYSERVEGLQLNGSFIKLRYGNRKGRYLMEMEMPPLAGSQREAVVRWLSLPATLSDIARGTPFTPAMLETLALLPAWSECKVGFSAKGKEGLELGVRFLCRALTVYPAYLLILRGLGGVEAIRRCIESELGQRQADFETAAATLPAGLAEFWAGASLPELPLPHEVAPGEGLGVHLPPATFWQKPEDNRLFMEALARTYKNIPRKLAKLTLPRRW